MSPLPCPGCIPLLPGCPWCPRGCPCPPRSCSLFCFVFGLLLLVFFNRFLYSNIIKALCAAWSLTDSRYTGGGRGRGEGSGGQGVLPTTRRGLGTGLRLCATPAIVVCVPHQPCRTGSTPQLQLCSVQGGMVHLRAVPNRERAQGVQAVPAGCSVCGARLQRPLPAWHPVHMAATCILPRPSLACYAPSVPCAIPQGSALHHTAAVGGCSPQYGHSPCQCGSPAGPARGSPGRHGGCVSGQGSSARVQRARWVVGCWAPAHSPVGAVDGQMRQQSLGTSHQMPGLFLAPSTQ